jgi:adenylate cyclase, class 2
MSERRFYASNEERKGKAIMTTMEKPRGMVKNLETEVKFHIRDMEYLRGRIIALGAVHKGRIFEKNLRFDTPDQKLMKQNALLRLRQADKALLTFKSKPLVEDTQFKTLTEYEVEVSNFESMKVILEALDYHPVQIYEKWRETFIVDHTQILMDSMPYGNFLELEGTGAGILDLVEKLGLDWNRRILLNYLAMFEILKKALDLPFEDVTFSHFSGLKIDLTEFLPGFYPAL